MKACELPKLHQEDPSGFWKLVRTGKDLPEIGQQILCVHDIRGTSTELAHDLFVKIATGDPYRITNENSSKMPPGINDLRAEFFKLPTAQAKPVTLVGYVQELGFDEILQEHWILIKPAHGTGCLEPEHIVYWAPMPMPFDGYTPREGDLADLYYTDGIVRRERDLHEVMSVHEM